MMGLDLLLEELRNLCFWCHLLASFWAERLVQVARVVEGLNLALLALLL